MKRYQLADIRAICSVPTFAAVDFRIAPDGLESLRCKKHTHRHSNPKSRKVYTHTTPNPVLREGINR